MVIGFLASTDMVKKYCSNCKNKSNNRDPNFPSLWTCDWNFDYCSLELPSLIKKDGKTAICIGFEELPPSPPSRLRIWLDRIAKSFEGKNHAEDTRGKTS